jgi:hypothetical protein
MLKGRQPGELFVKAFSGARGEGGASDFRMHFACIVDGQVNVEFHVKEQVCLGENPSRNRRRMRTLPGIARPSAMVFRSASEIHQKPCRGKPYEPPAKRVIP